MTAVIQHGANLMNDLKDEFTHKLRHNRVNNSREYFCKGTSSPKKRKLTEPKSPEVKKERCSSPAGKSTSALRTPRAPPKGSKFVGAHTSIAGGLYKAVLDATQLGAKAFGMFLKSQRQWKAKELDDNTAELFKKTLKDYGFSPGMVLPHGSYLLNCGSPNEDTLRKSRETLVDELRRCEKLGLPLYNFHPGSTCGKIATQKSVELIAESINEAHRNTKFVITVIENMSCQGNTLGGKFEELRDIIELVEDKSRVGVCIDTCHAFAAGYDLALQSGFDKMMDDLKNIIGLKYLKAVHLNDSKGKVGCHLDRHENIGKGQIGVEGFRRLMRHQVFNNIPMILETPPGFSYEKEIQKLYSLI
ncbi:hypothetical protein CAPTEDRAFT_212711 [Capitella teleta]|uniref:Xylose isomerase-like TIM barrel domain-containing protein n=1 Tax=Capitella teleta TaxID=283909 RepID=R7UJ60_CAPTE|nr:hypothetical protein CAPTEDRAFT_212711 [Capitella teleta]|eukprot:ELU06113.1 hypothetical protein CAPTEDRAFT_212711 [Capitella teleta]